MERKYVHLSKAWYGSTSLKDLDCVDEVWLEITSENDNLIGEFGLRWYDLKDGRPPTVKLEVFEDAFEALFQCKDLIDKLREWDNKYIQPEQLIKILKKLGFKDVTPYEEPYKK